MTDNCERCSCGARYKSKCVEESASGSGKMCLMPEDNLFKNFRDTLNGGFCADIDYESKAWQIVVDEWSEFKVTQTVLDATTAFEMIENPKEPNEKLIELLRLE